MQIKTTKHGFEAVRIVTLRHLEHYCRTKFAQVDGKQITSYEVLSTVMLINIFESLMDYLAEKNIRKMRDRPTLKLTENLAIALYLVLPTIPLASHEQFTIININEWIRQLDMQLHEIKLINQILIEQS